MYISYLFFAALMNLAFLYLVHFIHFYLFDPTERNTGHPCEGEIFWRENFFFLLPIKLRPVLLVFKPTFQCRQFIPKF